MTMRSRPRPNSTGSRKNSLDEFRSTLSRFSSTSFAEALARDEVQALARSKEQALARSKEQARDDLDIGSAATAADDDPVRSRPPTAPSPKNGAPVYLTPRGGGAQSAEPMVRVDRQEAKYAGRGHGHDKLTMTPHQPSTYIEVVRFRDSPLVGVIGYTPSTPTTSSTTSFAAAARPSTAPSQRGVAYPTPPRGSTGGSRRRRRGKGKKVSTFDRLERQSLLTSQSATTNTRPQDVQHLYSHCLNMRDSAVPATPDSTAATKSTSASSSSARPATASPSRGARMIVDNHTVNPNDNRSNVNGGGGHSSNGVIRQSGLEVQLQLRLRDLTHRISTLAKEKEALQARLVSDPSQLFRRTQADARTIDDLRARLDLANIEVEQLNCAVLRKPNCKHACSHLPLLFHHPCPPPAYSRLLPPTPAFLYRPPWFHQLPALALILFFVPKSPCPPPHSFSPHSSPRPPDYCSVALETLDQIRKLLDATATQLDTNSSRDDGGKKLSLVQFNKLRDTVLDKRDEFSLIKIAHRQRLHSHRVKGSEAEWGDILRERLAAVAQREKDVDERELRMLEHERKVLDDEVAVEEQRKRVVLNSVHVREQRDAQAAHEARFKSYVEENCGGWERE